MSRARVDGLHEIYITFLGFILIIVSKREGAQPFLGGSTTTMSAIMPFLYSFGTTSSAAPTTNSALVILLIRAFSLASMTASLTTSIPYTFPAFLAIKREIVPVPEYRSNTVSSPESSAY